MATSMTPLRNRNAPDVSQNHTSEYAFGYSDLRELPDLAVFRDGDAPWCPEMVMIPTGQQA